MNIKTPTCLTLHYVILVFWLILMQNRASFRQSRSYDTYTYCKILLYSGSYISLSAFYDGGPGQISTEVNGRRQCWSARGWV